MISSSVNIMHHPSDQQLIEYAAGSLPLSRALCVSAHLEHCPHCQQNYQRLQALGGIQMQSMADKPVSTSLKDKVLAAIKSVKFELFLTLFDDFKNRLQCKMPKFSMPEKATF